MESLQERATFATILAATMAASTFSLVVYSVLAADLLEQFDLERWQVGMLVTATTLAGALVSPSVGGITDRIGARRAAVITLLGSAAGLVAIALAPDYWWLIGAALASGVFQAVANPSTNKLIAEHVGTGLRGIITGIKQSGVQVGTFLGGLGLPALALAFGWRIAVLVFASGGVVWGAVAWVKLPQTLEHVMDGPKATRDELPRFIVRLAVYGFFLGAAGTAIFIYLPLFGQEALGLSAPVAGAAAALFGLTGVIARIAWGRVAEMRLGSERSLRIIAIGAVGAAALLYYAPDLPFLIWPAAMMTGLTASAWNAVGMLAVIQSVPSTMAGRSSGVVLLGFLTGLAVGSPAMGWSVDAFGSYRPGWIAVGFVFLLGWLTLRRSSGMQA